jgi:cytochrome b6-f complex iron-sulfur subunit/menaquinol-cytochrome c reductase iron-sulfur subunit
LKTIAVGGALGCGALAVPCAHFVLSVGGGAGEGRWIKTIPLDSLTEGEPKRIALIADRHDAWTLEKAVELGAAWLVRRGDTVRAWSVTCPHLGCAIDRASTGAGFYCPCHDSSFDTEGARLSGPSPRALDTLATRVDDGVVLVKFERFRQGIPEKVAVG